MQYKCKDLLIKENSIFVQFKEFTVSILFIIKLFLSDKISRNESHKNK